jgi:hypothetical protein
VKMKMKVKMKVKMKIKVNMKVKMRIGCHRPWYRREGYPDYGASSWGQTLE